MNEALTMSLRSADSPNDRRNVNVPGRDSVMLPESSLSTDTLGIAETSESKVATPRYGKRPSSSLHFSFVNFVSILPDLC